MAFDDDFEVYNIIQINDFEIQNEININNEVRRVLKQEDPFGKFLFYIYSKYIYIYSYKQIYYCFPKIIDHSTHLIFKHSLNNNLLVLIV